MRWILICLVVLIFCFMAYVRLAASDPTKVHVAGPPRDAGDYPTIGSFTAVRALTVTPEELLTALDQIARRTPRTVALAGSTAEGMMTFVTRSKAIGFPDYTTISIIPTNATPGGNTSPLVMIHGRLRFGSSDVGVNRKRIEGWLAQLGPMLAAS